MEPSSALPPICRKSPYVLVTPSRTREVFHVPRRFGLLAIMTLLTAYSVLFAGLRALDSHPVIFIGLGAFGIIVSGLQMAFGTVPRVASIAAGATLLPLTVLPVTILQSGWNALAFVVFFPLLVMFGGFFGYLVGAIMAGVFLVVDVCERRLFPRRSEPTDEVPAKM